MLKRLSIFLVTVLCFLSAISLVSCIDEEEEKAEESYWYCYKDGDIKYYICFNEKEDTLLAVDDNGSESHSFSINISKDEIEIEDSSKNKVLFSFEQKDGDYIMIDSIKFNHTDSAPKDYEKGSNSLTIYDFWKSITKSILPGIYDLSGSESVLELLPNGSFYFIGTETTASGTYTVSKEIITFTVNDKPSVDYTFSYIGDKLIINNTILTPTVINLGNAAPVTLGNAITTARDPIFDSIPSGFTVFDNPKTLYVNTTKLNVRSAPVSDSGNIIGVLNYQDKITAVAENETWTLIKFNGSIAYLSSDYLVEEKPADTTTSIPLVETDVPDSEFTPVSGACETVYVCPTDYNNKPVNASVNYYSSPNRSKIAGILPAGTEFTTIAKTVENGDETLGWSKLTYVNAETNETVTIYMRNSVISTTKPVFETEE